MRLLDAATNALLEPLSENSRRRIEAFLRAPCAETWDNAYSIIINGRSMRCATLWQAVRAVDPTFPHCKPVGGWERIPDAITTARAIRFACAK